MQRKNEQLSPQEQKILAKKAEEFPELYGKTDGGYKKLLEVVRNAREAVAEYLDFVENCKFCLIFNVLI